MQPPMPCPTLSWHNDTYADISPSRPELNAAGKKVIIIGASSGIGRETAIAFASAHAAEVVLVGRSRHGLEETATAIPADTLSPSHVVDISNEKDVADAAKAIQRWDVLVLAAAYCSDPSINDDADPDEWWRSYEVNVKGAFNILKYFGPLANSSGATLLCLTTGTTAMPAERLPGLSAYITSKLAQTKLVEYFAAEHPHVFTANVHPGMVETRTFTKSGAKAERLPMDKVQLPAHFLVWMASAEASFLRGRSVWANWDVAELIGKADSLSSSLDFTTGIYGWPFKA